jgi:uncharacterized protein YbjQ (UPF0145 family)
MPDNLAYCPKCGAPVSKKESSSQMSGIILSTTETVPNLEVAEILGVVSAPIAMARWFGADFMAGIKDVFGGRVSEYEKLMRNAADDAFERLKREAERLGADAVIGIKLFSPDIGGTRRIGEIVAYGTAVKLKSP